MKIIYTTEATASGGGRTGHSATGNGRVSVDLSAPKEMGGDNGPGTNPEELFATGHDEANRAAVKAVPSAALNLVGMALRDDRKVIDKVVNSLKFLS